MVCVPCKLSLPTCAALTRDISFCLLIITKSYCLFVVYCFKMSECCDPSLLPLQRAWHHAMHSLLNKQSPSSVSNFPFVLSRNHCVSPGGVSVHLKCPCLLAHSFTLCDPSIVKRKRKRRKKRKRRASFIQSVVRYELHPVLRFVTPFIFICMLKK